MTNLPISSILTAILAFAYTGLGSWRPSFWTDEAATLSAVRRDLPDLAAMLGNIDAVHGAYYFLMYGWTRVFGFSELSIRFPSIVAVAAAAFFMVEIGKKLSGLHLGLFAAGLLTLMPRTQYVGTDGRSYALTLLGAVVATYLLVSIRESSTPGKWIWYAVTGLMTVSFSFYCVLLVLAHAVTLLWDSRLRKFWTSMAVASIGWIAPAIFVGVVASQQQFQIAWIRDVGPAFPFELAFMQFFSDGYFSNSGHVVPVPTPGEDFTMFALASLFWILGLAGVMLCRGNFLLRLTLPWLVFPALAVVGGSLLTGGNYYLPRYLTFELPAMALIAAAPLAIAVRSYSKGDRSKARVGVAVALVAFVGLAVPSYIGQRTQFGRDPQDDFRFIANSVARMAVPGDCFIMNADSDLAFQAYPESFQGLIDPTIGLTAVQWGRIFNQRFGIQSSAEKVLRCSTTILVEKSDAHTMTSALEDMGYSAGPSERGQATTVTKYTVK